MSQVGCIAEALRNYEINPESGVFRHVTSFSRWRHPDPSSGLIAGRGGTPLARGFLRFFFFLFESTIICRDTGARQRIATSYSFVAGEMQTFGIGL